MGQVVVAESFRENERQRYKEFLKQIGTDVSFDSDKWVCDAYLRNPSDYMTKVTISFQTTPDEFKEMMKYYAIIRLLNGIYPVGIRGMVQGAARFLNYVLKMDISIKINQLNPSTASQYKYYLDGENLSSATKSALWQSVHVFLKEMNGYEGMHLKNPFKINPYIDCKRHAYKYIPDDVIMQLDQVFWNDEILLRFRLVYWLLRLIPSRISEILGMKIDCLKQFNGHYQLFLPTWKQNGGHREPILRTIRLENSGIALHLINLIQEQQKEAVKIQQYLQEQEKGYLFAYRDSIVLYGIPRDKSSYRLMKWNVISKMFKDACIKNDIRDDSGNIYRLTSHQFRHNGVTDRLAAGFTMEQIAEMTGHHGNAMIFESYTHLNLMPERIIQKQKYVLKEPEGKAIMFAGRILNLDEQLEKRLLKNIRAHRVRGGICGDITGCKSDMFQCLDCSHFIPEKEQLNYFREQAMEWEKKVHIFKGIDSIRKMAIKNSNLFQGIINQLESEEF